MGLVDGLIPPLGPIYSLVVTFVEPVIISTGVVADVMSVVAELVTFVVTSETCSRCIPSVLSCRFGHSEG